MPYSAKQQQEPSYQQMGPAAAQQGVHPQQQSLQQQWRHAQQSDHSAAVNAVQRPPSNMPPTPHQQHHSGPPQNMNGTTKRPVQFGPGPPPANNHGLAASLALNSNGPISATASVVGPALGRVICLIDQLALAAQSPELHHMRTIVNDFFTPTGVLKFSVLDRNTRATKDFEVPAAIMPRFSALQAFAGLTNMSFAPAFVREYFLTVPDPSPPHKPVHVGYVLDADATWTTSYDNGSRVDMRGFLRAHCVVTEARGLKIESLEFQAKHWDEVFVRENLIVERVERILIANQATAAPTPSNHNDQDSDTKPSLKRKRSATVDAGEGNKPEALLPTQFERVVLPTCKVGSFGLTEMGMRVLEIAEQVSILSDVIRFEGQTGMGPIAALSTLAEKYMEQRNAQARAAQQQQQQQRQGPPPRQQPPQQGWPRAGPIPNGNNGPASYDSYGQQQSPPSHQSLPENDNMKNGVQNSFNPQNMTMNGGMAQMPPGPDRPGHASSPISSSDPSWPSPEERDAKAARTPGAATRGRGKGRPKGSGARR